jgi:nitrite reductase/ring-hydroxylating ferredoxin subunit
MDTPGKSDAERAVSSGSDCESCGSCLDRRDFIAAGFGSALLITLAGALPSRAAAAPIRWIASLGSAPLRYPLPAGDGVSVDREHEVILVRAGGVVSAFALSCPHQRSMLRWLDGDRIFQCTKHRSRYTPLGEYRDGRATRNMDRLSIRLDGAEVVVDPSTVFKSDKDPGGWAAAVVNAS